MKYTDENFERFQHALEQSCGIESLLWKVRDSIFSVAFFGSESRINLLLSIPLGNIFALCLHIIRNWKKIHSAPKHHCKYANHILICSKRSNHTNRMLHVRKQLKPDNCFLWVVHNEGTEQFKSNSINNFSLIYNAWIRELSWRTLQEACNHVKKLQILCPGMFNLRARNRIFLFFVEFLAWKRVWKRCFKFAPNAVYSTFEKAASAKAFYLVAEDLKIGKRVHWMHGMRHSSLQATLATDIWCMTDADVNYFEAIVSSACIVRKKPSPEAQEMIAKGGMVDISYIRAKDTKNFLYLGVNLISSYDRKMRLEDLKIVKRAQVKYGESVRWRFRPHPGAIKQFHKDLHDAGIEAGDFSSQSLIEDVLWADAIGSPFSSILIDAHETGRPVFWMQSFIRPFGGAAELIEAGIGSLCDMDFIDNDFAEAIGIDS